MPPEEPNSQEESRHFVEETEESNSQRPRPAEDTPDITLDVPALKLEEAHLKVENLRARISLQAELADVVRINVGVDAFLEKVELDLKGLEAQAALKADLENVREILVRTLESLDGNPGLVDSLTQLAEATSNKNMEGVAGDFVGEEPRGDQEDQEKQEKQEGGETQEPDKPDRESAGEIEATDAARSKAEDLGVDLARVEGTGSGGRIIARDVQQAAKRK